MFEFAASSEFVACIPVLNELSIVVQSEDVNPSPVAVPSASDGSSAHVLGTLDDKIDLNRRMNETLEGMARALFK